MDDVIVPLDDDALDAKIEALHSQIGPTLKAFEKNAEYYCRKAGDEVYERLLYSVQDYLIDNVEWNLGEELRRANRIGAENAHLRVELRKLQRALVNHNDALADCYEIADRKGRDTDWPAVRHAIGGHLTLHDQTVAEARRALLP